MSTKPKTLFFIPVWNQAAELPGVLREIRESRLPCDEILIINNGSSDGSETLVRTCGFPFIDLPVNRGIGHSFMVAIDWALAHGFEVFGGIASNGKMIPAEMTRLLEPIYAGRADYVTGSRYLPGGESPNLPPFRRLAIPAVNLMVRALTGFRVSDATCGYKAMRLDLLRRAAFDWHAPWLNGYSFEYYLFAKVLLHGVRWEEVPVTMRYPPRGRRYSKIRPIAGWYDMLRPWVVARVDGRGFHA